MNSFALDYSNRLRESVIENLKDVAKDINYFVNDIDSTRRIIEVIIRYCFNLRYNDYSDNDICGKIITLKKFYKNFLDKELDEDELINLLNIGSI